MSKNNRTELKAEFLALAAVSSFAPYCSSPRMVMDFSHISSRVPLVKPDSKIFLTGAEVELGKYINDVRTEHNVTVKAKIEKPGDYEGAAETILLVEYEQEGKLQLDLIEVPYQRSSHGYFGYKLHHTPTLEDAGFNTSIPADTVLAATASLGPSGEYQFGLNANVAFMSHPSVSEDGFVVSESFMKRMQYTTVSKRIIYLTKENFPVNLYGNKEVFKMLPEIGEYVRADGLLCATRDRVDWFSVTDLNDESIGCFDPTFDDPVFVPPNSKVVDIRVVKGNWAKNEYPAKVARQLDEHTNVLLEYYDTIIRRYDSIHADYRKRYGSEFKLRDTPRLTRFIADCIIKRDARNGKTKLTHRKVNIDQYRIEVTCMSTVTPGKGQKIADMYGGKGVVCHILPDHCMPVDQNGVRADVVADANSTISRMNLGRVYEHYFGAYSRDSKYRIQQYIFNKYKTLSPFLDNEDAAYLRKWFTEIYTPVNSEMIAFLNGLDDEGLNQHVAETLNAEMSLYYPTDNENNAVDIIVDIEKTAHKPHLGPLTYVDDLGNTVVTEEDIRIGKLYYLVLDKVANDYSAVSSAKVNSFNFPIKGSAADKHKYPHSLTPTTTMSETEVRIMLSFADPALVAELMDLALNPVSHKLAIKDILTSEPAFNSEYNIDREADRYGQTKSLMLLKHIFTASGFDFEHLDTSEQ